MSACISRHGEYSEHVLEDGWCVRCGVFDIDAALAAEREACAQAVEARRDKAVAQQPSFLVQDLYDARRAAYDNAAAAIRARGVTAGETTGEKRL